MHNRYHSRDPRASQESLIKRCDTHIDAILSSGGEDQELPEDDLQYVQDLGLIAPQGLTIANPIYQEVILKARLVSEKR
ncbi:MAG: hypothetical protein FJZ58_01405 [Chlamydiae bacterium]|nr:hypothetical protein [Chlamydiota bacterium]